MKLLSKLAVLAMFGTPALFALTCGGDTSGNSTLKGSYRFRELITLSYDPTTFNVTEVMAVNGTLSFNGAGGYSLTGSYVDNMVSKGAIQNIPSTSGCYAIGASGVGSFADPGILAIGGGIFDYGALAQGVLTGSMTEAGQYTYSDGSTVRLANTFVAIPNGTPSNATFNAPYWTGVLDFTAGVSTHLKNALFKITPNGAGGFGSISITGQDVSQKSGAQMTQTSSGGTYNFASDGTATLNITAPSGISTTNALFTGAKTMYASSDGGYVLGWTPNGYDIFFGVRTLAQPATQSIFKGTYYTSALEFGPQPYCSGSLMDAYSGAMSADGAGNEIVHQRLWSAECLQGAYDYTADDATQLNSDGTLAGIDYGGYLFAFGNGGSAFVGVSGDLFARDRIAGPHLFWFGRLS
jgi:hypothetical protein